MNATVVPKAESDTSSESEVEMEDAPRILSQSQVEVLSGTRLGGLYEYITQYILR